MAMSMNAKRRTLEFAVLAVIVLIPVLGILRIDVTTGRFIVFNHYVLWGNFPLIFGSGALLIAAFALIYTLWGNAFCGWACPQNTLSEFTDKIMHKFLGRKGTIGVDTADGKFATKTTGQRNKLTSYLWITLILAAASAAEAVILLLYFFEPMEVVRQLTGTATHQVDNFWMFFWLGFFVVFIDIFTIRHAWCRYLCPYKLMPVVFWNKRVMKLVFDEKRSDECKTCQLCNVSCFMYLDPRTPEAQDLCVDCGECITACEVVNEKRGRAPLLKFYEGWFGWFNNVRQKFGGIDWLKVGAPLALMAIFTGMLIYGWSAYVPVDLNLSLKQNLSAQGADGVAESQYRIRVLNKALAPRNYHIEVRGINPEVLSFVDKDLPAGPGQELSIPLTVRLDPTKLQAGSNTLVVVLTSPDRPDIRLIDRATVVMAVAAPDTIVPEQGFDAGMPTVGQEDDGEEGGEEE